MGNIGDLMELHNGRNHDLEVTCKRHRFGYWNSCKRLPYFVNVAALEHLVVLSTDQSEQSI